MTDVDLRAALGWAVRIYLAGLFGVGVYSAVWLYRVWWRAQDASPFDSMLVSVAWFSVAGIGLLVLVSFGIVWVRSKD